MLSFIVFAEVNTVKSADSSNSEKMEVHPQIAEAFLEHRRWWRQSTDELFTSTYPFAFDKREVNPNKVLINDKRCSDCWLRSYDCYCKVAIDRSTKYNNRINNLLNMKGINVEVVVYYHYLEIGRSANTTHLFQLLCPSLVKTLIHGDTEKEKEFFQALLQEKLSANSETSTCFLYPCKQSICLNTFLNGMAIRNNHDAFSTNLKDYTNSNCNDDIHTIRFVIIDGTYGTARRITKYINNSADYYKINIDWVHLNLELLSPERRRSALAGVMYQPAIDKISSYQAAIYAIQQTFDYYFHNLIYEENETKSKLNFPSNVDTGTDRSIDEFNQIINGLIQELEDWLAYLVKNKIKYGKMQCKPSIKEVDNAPAEYLEEIISELRDIYKKPRAKHLQRETKVEHDYHDENNSNLNKKANGKPWFIVIKSTNKFSIYDRLGNKSF